MAGSLKPSFGAIVQQARDNALKDFPTERLKYVREGDFAEALRLLNVLAYAQTGWQVEKAVTETRAMLKRLQPEPEQPEDAP